MDDTKEYKHESYGLARFSRISSSGRCNLFGSAIQRHHAMVTMTISRATLGRDLNRDWYHPREELIEITLSAAQFAELLTTMNCGVGVPCTIEHVGMKRMESPPDINSEPEQIRTDFKQHQKEFAKEIRERGTRIMESVQTLSKKRREAIQSELDMIVQHVASNMPFALSSFQEATEKVLVSAKTEAEAFITHAVQAAGLRSIKQLQETIEPERKTLGERGINCDPDTGYVHLPEEE